MLSKCYVCLSSFPSLEGTQILPGLGMAQGSNPPGLDCCVEKYSEAQSWLHGKECCDRLVMSVLGRGLGIIVCVP